MYEEVYRILEQRLLLYANKHIIPSIKKHMAISGQYGRYNATGDYSRQLKTSIAKRIGSIISINITSTDYSKYVEGGHSGFDAEGYYCNKTGIDRIARWAAIRGLSFRRESKDGSFSGKLLTPTQTAFVIVKKWKVEGKKKRFFIEHIVSQHIERFQKELYNEVFNEE